MERGEGTFGREKQGLILTGPSFSWYGRGDFPARQDKTL
jgi:hypothetical protein